MQTTATRVPPALGTGGATLAHPPTLVAPLPSHHLHPVPLTRCAQQQQALLRQQKQQRSAPTAHQYSPGEHVQVGFLQEPWPLGQAPSAQGVPWLQGTPLLLAALPQPSAPRWWLLGETANVSAMTGGMATSATKVSASRGFRLCFHASKPCYDNASRLVDQSRLTTDSG
jgi:hypothetical protein